MTAAELTNGGSWCARCVQGNAACTNDATPGTDAFTCECNAGYATSGSGDGAGVVCTDIDECAATPCDVPPLPKRDI